MKKKKSSIAVLILSILVISACAGIRSFRSDVLFRKGEYEKAAKNYQKNIEQLKFPSLINYLTCLKLMNHYTGQKQILSRMTHQKECPDSCFLIYAEVLKTLSNNEESRLQIGKYLDTHPSDVKAVNMLIAIANEHEFLKDSSATAIGLALSDVTSKSCIAPAFFRDGIIFSVEEKINSISTFHAHADKSFYVKYDDDYNLQQPEPVIFSNNKILQAGCIAVSPSEGFLYYTSNRMTEKHSRQNKNHEKKTVMRAAYDAGKWKQAEDILIFYDNRHSIFQPCISADGNTLYFSSDMPGGYGGSDIWYSEWKSGQWEMPENMGPNVNTPGNEIFPFSAGNGILFFASDYWPGMGGYDIFQSILKNNQWEPAWNVGYPVNSSFDDISLIIDKTLMNGFFSTNRFGNTGKFSLMQFARTNYPLWYKAPEIQARLNESQTDTLNEIPLVFFRNMSANKNQPMLNNRIEFIYTPMMKEQDTVTDSISSTPEELLK